MHSSLSIHAPSDCHRIFDEIAAGEGLTLGEAAALLPSHRPGRRCHPSTVWRWAVDGVAVGGAAVKLEVCRLGARWYSSRPALARFLAAQNQGAEPPRVRRVSKGRQAEIAAVEAQLRKAGI